jgi:putative copper resistance protein D
VAAVAALLVATGAAAVGFGDIGIYPRLGIDVAPPHLRMLVGGLRTAVELGSAMALGLLLYAAFLVPAQPSGTLSVDGYRALHRAGWSAAAAAVSGLLLAAATAADATGASLSEVLGGPGLLTTFAALEEPMGWLLGAVGLGAVAVGCRITLGRQAVSALAGLAAVALLPPTVVGQAVGGRAHDWASDAAAVQAVALAVVVGVAAAVTTHPRPADPGLIRRARIPLLCAAPCWMLATLVLALVLVPPGSLVGTAWGRWQLVEAGLAVVLAALALLLVRRPAGRRVHTALLGVGALLVVVGTAKAHTVPPRFLVYRDTEAEVLVGYDLPDPFTALRAVLDWRVNILFALAAVVAVALYVRGVQTLRRRGDRWPPGRTAAWAGGWLVVLIMTSSGLGRYAPAMFSVHMISHMALNMLAPVLLALGGPVTLALRALRPAGRGRPAGPREWLTDALDTPALRMLTHPLVTLVLFVGSFYLLYFTGLFETALRFHWAHQLMNIHFLAVGYLFFWPLIGVDRAPVRLPPPGRLAVLLAAMPFHAFFGIALMNADMLLGGDFYRFLALPWLPDLLADQRVGGGIAWATGELPVLLVVIVLLVQWSREDARVAARHDRHADLDGDAELRAYNEMLARLSAGRS